MKDQARRLLAAAILGAAILAASGCATTPSIVVVQVATDGAKAFDPSGHSYAWLLDEGQGSDPVIEGVISSASPHLQAAGMELAANPETADYFVAIRTQVGEGEELVTYNFFRQYVPGPRRTYEREVEVYDVNGNYVGTRRENVTEREPGYYVNQRQRNTTEIYDHRIEFSFIDAAGFNEEGTDPTYWIGARNDGRSQSLANAGGCIIDTLFTVFPDRLGSARTIGTEEEEPGACALPGF